MTAHALVTVGTTAVNLLAGVADTVGFGDEKVVSRSLSVQNVSDATIYLGGPGVTTASYGYALAAGATIGFDLMNRDTLYAVSAAGGKSVAVLHLGI